MALMQHHWKADFWQLAYFLHRVTCHKPVMKWTVIRPRDPGSRFNINMTSYQYRKSHCGNKTMLRPSYLHNGISYTGKMTSLYWIGAQLHWPSYANYVATRCFIDGSLLRICDKLTTWNQGRWASRGLWAQEFVPPSWWWCSLLAPLIIPKENNGCSYVFQNVTFTSKERHSLS